MTPRHIYIISCVGKQKDSGLDKSCPSNLQLCETAALFKDLKKVRYMCIIPVKLLIAFTISPIKTLSV